MIKNDILLRALRGEELSRPPVWIMRQAGRYLPDFRAIRAKYSFFECCQRPELVSEITIMPVKQIGVDAAILFSDILVVPKAMGIDIEMKEGIGPYIQNPIRSESDLKRIFLDGVIENLSYVFKAVGLTKRELNGQVPLIGFAGSPWTILCYITQGQGSKVFDKTKELCYREASFVHRLLQLITDVTIEYLKEKIRSGCDVIQIFDSWGGILSPYDYDNFSWKYIQQIIDAIKPMTKIVVFAKGCWYALEKMSESGVDALGIDWTISPKYARSVTNGRITLQGNLDPSCLFYRASEIDKVTNEMIDNFGSTKYIVNLGHGILPNIPLDNVKTFVESVKKYSREQ
ncbi:uroporphyrinogen decarboxylase [Ichthyobacterium seriolicida]|uniref:Uroporphyrinogen decarboxylase n=1 Tax=Ichthyobacterium seriolicida TaxID=242600 RepID=A0A1J1DW93_9FLAO|nr:uroporphyrinogen decarboxylase [Ichthyobacterium seriolicida]BAV94130.1 uroporphyrinogen III decarboxylase [Ichthyobacterium seriolicida]